MRGCTSKGDEVPGVATVENLRQQALNLEQEKEWELLPVVKARRRMSARTRITRVPEIRVEVREDGLRLLYTKERVQAEVLPCAEVWWRWQC